MAILLYIANEEAGGKRERKKSFEFIFTEGLEQELMRSFKQFSIQFLIYNV